MKVNITQCRKREYNRFRSRSTIALVLAFLLLLLPEIAEACSATGLFTLGGGDRRCDTTQTGIFATVLCFFETALESMLGTMYCTFQTRMQGPLAAAFGIFITLFGVCILSGYFRMQFREAVKVVAKLALVMVFAINSDYAIQLTGKFFMGMLQSGTQFVLNPLGGSTSLTQPDSAITGMINFMTNPNVSELGSTNNCDGLPCLNDAVLKIITNCAAFLAVLGLALVVFLPVVLAFLFILFIQYISLYVKSLLSYLTSIVIITFLLILSPLFVSFALFSATSELFTRWRQYLQMFSIQGIILFAFLAMLGVITQGFTGFLYGLLRLLRPYDVTVVISLWTIPINACSICEYKIDQLANGSQTISCQPAVIRGLDTPLTVTPGAFPPRTGTSGVTNAVSAIATMPDAVDPVAPITYDLTMGSVLSSKENDIPGEPSQHGGWNYVIPITNLLKKADFMLYVAMNIIAFGIVASLFHEFIGKSTDLSKKLGGVSGGGGFGGHADFEGGSIELGGGKAFAAGIKGMEKEMLRDPFNNVDGNIFSRFRDGIFGRGTVSRKDFNTDEGYLEAKKGEQLRGGFLGALMYGATGDGEKEKEYDLKLAQRRVDDAALKLRETREFAEAAARELSDALDAQEAAKKKGNEVENAAAAKRVAKAADAYNTSYEAALVKQKTLRDRKQDLRDTEFEMQKGLQGGLMPARGKVIEPEVGAAALFASSATLNRAGKAYKKLKKEDPDGSKGFYKKELDPNAVAAASGRSTGGNTSGRNNSSDDVISAQAEANKKLDELDEQMKKYGRLLNETKKADHLKAIATAKVALGKAKTESETFEIMKGVRETEAAFDRFSKRNVMEGVAVAGTAVIGAYLLKASGIVPTAYLEEAAKFLDGADKEIKKGEAGAAEVARIAEEMPEKLAQSVVAGAQEQASLAARIATEESLQKTNAQIAEAETALQTAKEPMDYMNILASLESLPRDQLASVLGDLEFRRDKAKATLVSAVAMPQGWEAATNDSKRNYIDNVVAKTRQELDSTSGVRSDEDNEAHRKELDKIKEDAATASTEEEFKQILQRNMAVQKAVDDSVLPGSAFDIFALFNQKVGQAQAAAGSAKTGDDHSRVLSSLLSAPQDLNHSVISVLQQHTQRKDNLMPPHLRQKMETELAKAHIEAQRAVTGEEQDGLLDRLGRSFVGGGKGEATIAMTQWDNTPEDKKREAAEKLLADAKEKFEGIASKLSDKDRKAYEEELSKASASLAAASNGEQMRDTVAHTISIRTVLKESGLKVDTRQERDEARRVRRQAEHAVGAREISHGGVTMGEVNLGSHVMMTLRDYDITKDSHKKDYGNEILAKIEGTYQTASSELSEAEKVEYQQKLTEFKEQYGSENATGEERRSAIAKAAALEGHLLITARYAQEEAEARKRDAEDDAEEPVFEGDIPRHQQQDLTALMPALDTSMLTGSPTMGYALYTQLSLQAFDGIDDKRKREYVSAFFERSKKDIDAIGTISAEQKQKHKKELEQISLGLTSEASDKEMRKAMEQALAAVGRVNAGNVAVESSTPASSASSSSAEKPEPMSTSVGRIEVAGIAYQTSEVYDGLNDGDKERVQNILARNPEMTLQQAITQMNDEQALKRSRSRSRGEEVEDLDTSEEEAETTKKQKMSQNAQKKAHQQEQKRVQTKAKKTRDNLSMGQLQKIREMMQKNPGMTQEHAIEKLGLKGKI